MAECHGPHDVFDRELRALRDLLDVRFRAIEQTAESLRDLTDARFDSSNEWRGKLDADRRDFVTRHLFDARLDWVTSRLAEVDKRGAVTAAVVSLLVSVAMGLLSLLTKR